jgi:hypothetical protein
VGPFQSRKISLLTEHSSDPHAYSSAAEEGIEGGWRNLHSEGLHNLYSSSNIIRMIKSRRMRWEGHIAGMEEEE